MPETHRDSQLDIVTEVARPKTASPPLYKVVMVNDDFTPMGFVVEVLQSFFHHGREKAVQIMLQVHTQGRAVAGVYPLEIAETKVSQVNNHSRKHQHPLLCVMEKA